MEVCKGLGGVVDLAENLVRAFNDPDLFELEKDEYGRESYWTDSGHLPFPIEDELINGEGRCNWDAIFYVETHANVRIHSGEEDSFGWLTAVITPKKKPEWTNGKSVNILYG